MPEDLIIRDPSLLGTYSIVLGGEQGPIRFHNCGMKLVEQAHWQDPPYTAGIKALAKNVGEKDKGSDIKGDKRVAQNLLA